MSLSEIYFPFQSWKYPIDDKVLVFIEPADKLPVQSMEICIILSICNIHLALCSLQKKFLLHQFLY